MNEGPITSSPGSIPSSSPDELQGLGSRGGEQHPARAARDLAQQLLAAPREGPVAGDLSRGERLRDQAQLVARHRRAVERDAASAVAAHAAEYHLWCQTSARSRTKPARSCARTGPTLRACIAVTTLGAPWSRMRRSDDSSSARPRPRPRWAGSSAIRSARARSVRRQAHRLVAGGLAVDLGDQQLALGVGVGPLDPLHVELIAALDREAAVEVEARRAMARPGERAERVQVLLGRRPDRHGPGRVPGPIAQILEIVREAEPDVDRAIAMPGGHPGGLGVVGGGQQVEAVDLAPVAPVIGGPGMLLAERAAGNPGDGEAEVLAVPGQRLTGRPLAWLGHQAAS